MTRKDADVHGVLVVDKPVGPTSHDVVARLRRVLGTRRVGHAGTLDPAASGVLVVLIGEGTKLSPYLTAHDKVYAATVALGTATSTWDSEGAVVATGSIPQQLVDELATLSPEPREDALQSAPMLQSALAGERARRSQTPPSFSAIKRDGQVAHELARRGEALDLAPRPVEVRELRIVRVGPHELDIVLRVAKGYYVRSFAHDLGVALGVPAHLAALRRLASGPFMIEEACATLENSSAVATHLQPVSVAVRRAMPVAELTAAGAAKAAHGQPLGIADFVNAPCGSPAAWLNARGELVAVGAEASPAEYRAVRGFPQVTSSEET